MRKTLGERLAYEGYAIEATDDVSEASEMCRQMAFDVVLTDDSSNASPLGIPFIVLAGAGDNQIQRAVTAFRDGAMDFLQIPSDINRLYDTLRRYSEEEAPTQTPLPKQRMSAHAMGRARRTRASSVQPIIGSSNAIGNVRQVVERIAASIPVPSSPARTGPARSWSPAGSTPRADGLRAPSSKSTARPFPRS